MSTAPFKSFICFSTLRISLTRPNAKSKLHGGKDSQIAVRKLFTFSQLLKLRIICSVYILHKILKFFMAKFNSFDAWLHVTVECKQNKFEITIAQSLLTLWQHKKDHLKHQKMNSLTLSMVSYLISCKKSYKTSDKHDSRTDVTEFSKNRNSIFTSHIFRLKRFA